MAEYDGADAPVEEDTRHDDLEFNPALEPKSAKAWLNLLLESEDAFEPWNAHCDNVDRIYASLEKLSTSDASDSSSARTAGSSSRATTRGQ